MHTRNAFINSYKFVSNIKLYKKKKRKDKTIIVNNFVGGIKNKNISKIIVSFNSIQL